MDKTKKINANCVCNTLLITKREHVIMLDPCEHLIHKSCFFEKMCRGKCPYCNTEIKNIIRHSDYKINPKLYQKCIDILSVTNFDLYTHYDPLEVITHGTYNFFNIIDTIINLTGGVKTLCNKIFRSGKVSIRLHGSQLLDSKPKVYIANHTSYLDAFVLSSFLDTYFLSSSQIMKYPFGENIVTLLKLLLIDRNKSKGTTEIIKTHLGKNKSVCIFPEGMLSHPETLVRFRTGAFNTGYPVQPIVIKYNNVVMDIDPVEFICKIITGSEGGVVDVYILDTYYPPFDIEKIRRRMARKGKLLLARTSNYDIVD